MTTPAIPILRVLLLVAFFAPIIVYVWMFGAEISTDHQRWSEFGAAMGGMYSPILAVATIAVLALQFKLQSAAYAHTTDADYIQQARADVEFYVERLSVELTRTTRVTLGFDDSLKKRFLIDVQEDFDNVELKEAAHNLNRANPRVFSLYCALQSVLAGLSASSKPMYRMNRESAIQKMTAMLSFEVCVALENYHYVVSEGRFRGPYVFSKLLETMKQRA